MSISLLHGVVPLATQAAAAVTLALAIGWRTRRWRRVLLPLSVVIGIGVTLWLYWYISDEGWGDTPPPRGLWVWVALTGFAAAVLVLGWRSAAHWRRAVTVLAVPLCVLSAALSVNLWVGYVPDVQAGWNQLTAGPLPDQINATDVTALVANTRTQHQLPAKGRVVEVSVPDDASHFTHRDEYVYLPPAWFATSPPPELPAVVMIGGEFNTPADWLRAGNAINTLDAYAAAHQGNAPVTVFADVVGTFHNDTECVNGPRGNAADHITKDLVPYVESHFGVSDDASRWGVAGWSMGGTCAVDLAAMHPDQFGAFDDMAGDIAPNAGDPSQTLARLYGGNAAAEASFDPVTVMQSHGKYTSTAGLFVSPLPQFSQASQAQAAQTLNTAAHNAGIDSSVVPLPGNHDWGFAATAFANSLPWLATALHTPSASASTLTS